MSIAPPLLRVVARTIYHGYAGRRLGLVTQGLRPRGRACCELRRERPLLPNRTHCAGHPEDRPAGCVDVLHEPQRRRSTAADAEPAPLLLRAHEGASGRISPYGRRRRFPIERWAGLSRVRR